ncbi:hypothetical protein [Streptomyces sp. SHP 1-2]|uniref:hypothetical protein n=1 Tax=Streptomyces sp. SHP 1-2 TaxID=2769489 RepID=UPI0022389871|nr:hypothetical protein [Streptomyces sp. SHP 1-2]MCW5252471.1 hypothetical protein [Streptomyces sp. SHP 1-2]
MTADIEDLVGNLVRAMARREAAALTSTADRLPDLAVRSVVCPCGAVAAGLADGLPPARRGEVLDLGADAPAATGGLPLLTRLACERLDNRSLLPVAVALLRRPGHPVRLRTRAVALREPAGPGGPARPPWPPSDPPDPGELLPVLRRLNDEEAWWPAPPSAAPAGAPAWTLPVTTQGPPAEPEPRGAAFLGPHGDGPGLAELNEAYARHRMDAVLKAL